MNPRDITYANGKLQFRLDNFQFCQFLDIYFDDNKSVRIQHWAPWTNNPANPPKFTQSQGIVQVDLTREPMLPTRSIEIFTRYDYFTRNGDAGYAKFSIPVPPSA